MSGIQTILTFAAFFMLVTAALNFNRAIVESDITLSQNRYRLEALSILDAHAHDATQFYFDETTLDTTLDNTLTNMTTPANLGLDLGDGGTIDDFDDYHNMTITDSGRSTIPYQLSFEVEYVTLSSDSFTGSGTQQWHKRMTISVYDASTTPYLYRIQNGARVRDTLTVSFVHSYWFYN